MSAPNFKSFSTKLKSKSSEILSKGLKNLFQQDPHRIKGFFIQAGPLAFDFSKQVIDQSLLKLFCDYADATDYKNHVKRLFKGDSINTTEHRAVMHWLLRAKNTGHEDQSLSSERQLILETFNKMKLFTNEILNKSWRSETQKPIQNIVNLGVGGSDLGPRLVMNALTEYKTHLDIYFVANIDGYDLTHTLENLNPEETLFVITSKTFSTLETLENAKAAKSWLMSAGLTHIENHFVAATSQIDKAIEFGLSESNLFPMWDWVGGRYSLLSSVGLSVMLGIGSDNFEQICEGASAIDEHFTQTPLETNAPFLMAVTGITAINGLDILNHAVIGYDSRLELLPNYLQQLEMESNGKSTSIDGNKLNYNTCPILWGGIGTNTQHSFHQLLHQGTLHSNIDFLMPTSIQSNIKNNTKNRLGLDLENHTMYLQANCLAQAQALFEGKSLEAVKIELKAQGLSQDEIEFLAPHKVIPGNKPSTIIGYPDLTPEVLGAIIATYEHKVFVQSHFWNINAYDQWGVELGKKLCQPLFNGLKSGHIPIDIDPSTQHWIQTLHNPKLHR